MIDDLTPEQRAIADQLEAEARQLGERFVAQTQQEADLSVAKMLRAQGHPVVRARGKRVGGEMVFDLTLAQPRGVG